MESSSKSTMIQATGLTHYYGPFPAIQDVTFDVRKTVHVEPGVESGTDIRDEISKAVISSGWSLLSLQTVGMSLEEIFLKLTTHEDL